MTKTDLSARGQQVIVQSLNRSLRRAARVAKGHVARGIAATRRVTPQARRRDTEIAEWRAAAESRLASMVASNPVPFSGTVLLDGMFDNANYWYRLALLRSALGLASGREVGITGPHNARLANKTFAQFGVTNVMAFDEHAKVDDRRNARFMAAQLAASTKTPEDVLHWQLPYDVPPELIYDGLLKEQRRPSVDPSDGAFRDLVEAVVLQIHTAARLIERHSPDLLILSHSCHVRYGALAHLAIQRQIPAIVAFGNYGVPRYFRLDCPGDLADPVDCPRGNDLDRLDPNAAERLAGVGRSHLRARRAGVTNDIGGRYAFASGRSALDRTSVATTFGWDSSRPIVAVYAANWFDFPHYMGMTNFRDFSDFILSTLAVARTNTAVNWLFRRHPVDDFYGGPTLSDVLPKALPNHIAICPTDWNSNDVMTNADAIVTYHGTIGIEAPAIGTPVLVADRGWYHDCGFVTWPGDRSRYLAALEQNWWCDVDTAARRRRAEIFAGWYFATPAWQGGLVCGDDSRQSGNFPSLLHMLDNCEDAIERELEEIAQWWRSGSRFYHTTKMANTDTFAIGNVVGIPCDMAKTESNGLPNQNLTAL